jgi:hypothetical protein
MCPNGVLLRKLNHAPNDLAGDEVERRRDDALRRALNTPPQPRKPKPKKVATSPTMTKKLAKPKPKRSSG